MDQEKLRTMIQFCQTTQCRTRYILEHFGEEIIVEWVCGNCDACDAMEEAAPMAREAAVTTAREAAVTTVREANVTVTQEA
jgi:superfamily II DNA helicase RecQ